LDTLLTARRPLLPSSKDLRTWAIPADGRPRQARLWMGGLLVLGSIGLQATSARAQEAVRKGDLELGLDLGWSGFQSNLVKPNGTRLSIYGDYHLTRRIALVADITCLGGSERAPADSLNFTLCTGSLGGSLDLRARSRLVPYLRMSVGQAQLDRDAREGEFDIDDRSAALEAAAGARLYLGKRRRMSVRADALWTRAGVFEGWSTHTSVSLGVAYRIGPDSTQVNEGGRRDRSRR